MKKITVTQSDSKQVNYIVALLTFKWSPVGFITDKNGLEWGIRNPLKTSEFIATGAKYDFIDILFTVTLTFWLIFSGNFSAHLASNMGYSLLNARAFANGAYILWKKEASVGNILEIIFVSVFSTVMPLIIGSIPAYHVAGTTTQMGIDMAEYPMALFELAMVFILFVTVAGPILARIFSIDFSTVPTQIQLWLEEAKANLPEVPFTHKQTVEKKT